MFTNILVAVDGSIHAAKALDYAIELAEKYEAKISIVHVVPSLNAFSEKKDDKRDEHLEAARTGFEEAGKTVLLEGEKIVKLAGIAVNPILKHGSAADKIIEVAEELHSDLIVIGDRGLGSVTRFPFGSIVFKVSQYAKCPVLIIK
jgi:nucleotide-binding universal stress UspA family protein